MTSADARPRVHPALAQMYRTTLGEEREVMRMRGWSAAVVAVGMIAALSGWGSSNTVGAALARPYPIHLVESPFGIATIQSVDNVSSDGRFAVVATNVGPRHVSIPSGALSGLVGDGFVADDGGVFAYRVGGLRSIVQLRLATGELTEFDVRFPTPGVTVSAVIDADASGRHVLIDGRLASSTRPSHYVLDTSTGIATAPIYGEGFAAVDGTPAWRSISADGRFAVADWSPIQGASIRHETIRVDLITGDLVIRRAPDVEGFPGGTSFVSSDLEWMVFQSSQADVVPGTPAGLRLYRRNLTTGVTDIVPVDAATLRKYDVADGGRVVLSHVVPTQSAPDARQLSVWEGTGPLETITVGIDGELADLGVDESDLEFELSTDASRITFTSRATNLAAGAVTPARRVYQAVLPALERSAPSRPLLPDESVCVAVPGAAPGEFVGVNVTPVAATAAGFGVAHSSDEAAGATSNVNFGPGTVDPNVAFVRAGVDGEICYTNSRHGPVHVVIDAMVIGDAAAVRPISPVETSRRLIDTREADPVGPGGSRCVQAVTAQPGEFVGVNVTPVEATGAGFGTMHASGASPSGASTVNFAVGSVDPNFAFVQVGTDGGICFTNSVHATVDVIVDQLVVVGAAAMRAPTNGPTGARVIDTRIDGLGPRLTPSASVCFGVPDAVAGEFVAVNLTPVAATGAGFGTLHANGSAPGGSSNVNFGPGTFDPNLGISAIGTDGEVCFTNSVHASVDVIADAQAIGSPSVFRTAWAAGSRRLLDTREALP